MLRSLFRGLKLGADNLVAIKHSRSYTSDGVRRLEGKVAIITGGASGIGKATAHEFIQNGAHVILADVNSNLGQQAATELGPAAHFVQCDVAVEAQVEEAVNTAITRHGKLDIMYNNAGIPGPSIPPSILDLNLKDFDKVMEINVRGIVVGIKHASRAMVSAGSGCILCTSSVSGLMGGLGPHPYSISKFAIPGIVKSVASELSRCGVRINCISPGPVATAMSVGEIGQFYPGASREQIIEIINGLGELKGAKCEEIDVAKAALFLASEDAKYISGHNLVVDGGFTCSKSLSLPSHDQFV